jgi:hypothetical protein
MRVARYLTVSGYAVIGLVVTLSVGASPARAQSARGEGSHHATPSGDRSTSALVDVVRQSTERFRDVSVATAEGYGLLFGCVSGPDYGAMGMHFVKMPLVADGEVDATRPEIVIYEPLPNGRLRLVGADFLVLADAWHAKHAGAPELMGQLFHLFEAPNRFGLPAFYTLHVWAWKDNPTGTFANWHSRVSCDGFSGPGQ